MTKFDIFFNGGHFATPSKTNHDYIYEIGSLDFQKQFSTLSYFFEYVWYGQFQPEQSHYNQMKSTLTELKEKISEDR